MKRATRRCPFPSGVLSYTRTSSACLQAFGIFHAGWCGHPQSPQCAIRRFACTFRFAIATTGTKTVNANPRAIGAEPWRGAAAGLSHPKKLSFLSFLEQLDLFSCLRGRTCLPFLKFRMPSRSCREDAPKNTRVQRSRLIFARNNNDSRIETAGRKYLLCRSAQILGEGKVSRTLTQKSPST